MPAASVRPFQAHDIPLAGALLAARHRTQRLSCPLLSPSYEHEAAAAVVAAARGLGAGQALGEAVIAWTAQAGYHSIVTDWRVTNLLSSRTWPKLGFAESFLRLHRLIGY